MLSKRLKAICDLVDYNSKVIDVGADHGLVDIYLTKFKNCECVATDISEKCILKARENIKKAGLDIKTVVSDGLCGVDVKDEVIIVSGMGGHTVLKILENIYGNDLIISCHSDEALLRKVLQKKGYYISFEKVVFDKRYYVISYFKYGKGKRQNNYLTDFIDDDGYIDYLADKYRLKFKYEKNFFLKLFYYKIIKKDLHR